MRTLPLLAVAAMALTLLAGCSSKTDTPAPDAALQGAGGAAAGLANQTAAVQMHFAGGFREFDLPVAETFAPTDVCTFVQECPQRSIDLTPLVPPDVPVELSVVLSVNSNIEAGVQGDDSVSFVQYSSEAGGSDITIDVLLVRAPAGTVQLVLYAQFTSLDGAASGPAVTGNVHSVVRASVVPAYVPVSVQLGPGDVVNATGDGLEQLVAYSPAGTSARDTTAPFGFTLPADAPTGAYTLFAVADEAVRLLGPNRTLSAQRLVFSTTDPVELQSGQATTWEMPVPGLPVEVGVVLGSKQTVPDCCSAASYIGSRTIDLKAPGNVAVVTEEQTGCVPLLTCPTAILGNYNAWYGSPFLDESLTPGTYTATVTPDVANNAQAFSWALYIE